MSDSPHRNNDNQAIFKSTTPIHRVLAVVEKSPNSCLKLKNLKILHQKWRKSVINGSNTIYRVGQVKILSHEVDLGTIFFDFFDSLNLMIISSCYRRSSEFRSYIGLQWLLQSNV